MNKLTITGTVTRIGATEYKDLKGIIKSEFVINALDDSSNFICINAPVDLMGLVELGSTLKIYANVDGREFYSNRDSYTIAMQICAYKIKSI